MDPRSTLSSSGGYGPEAQTSSSAGVSYTSGPPGSANPAAYSTAEYTNPGLQTVPDQHGLQPAAGALPAQYSPLQQPHLHPDPNYSAYQYSNAPQSAYPASETAYASTYGGHSSYQHPPPVKYDMPAIPPKTEARILGVKRRTFLILLAVIILAIIGAVVGGVVGTRKSDSEADGSKDGGEGDLQGSGEGNSNNDNDKPTTTPTAKDEGPKLPEPTLIAKKSGLAATGWERAGVVDMRLFFQDEDGNIIHLSYNPRTERWGLPEVLVEAMPESNLLALDCYYVEGEPADHQINIYYFDSVRNCLQEFCLFESGRKVRGELSNECVRNSVAPKSGIAGYWPTIIFQGQGGGLVEYTQTLKAIGSFWSLKRVGVDGIEGGSIATFPLTKNYTGLSTIYQREDKRIAEQTLLLNEDEGWKAGSLNSMQGIPAGASMAGLAFAPFGSDDALHQYILYQTESGEIAYYSRVASDSAFEATDWKGPKKDDALKYARKGTQIACITPTTSQNTTLAEEPSLAKCFFQLEGGQVRQVSVNSDGKWAVDQDIIL